MTTKNPRIHTVLEEPLFKIVERLAKQDGHSLSEEAAELIREAVTLREDRALDVLAQARRSTFNLKKALTLGQIRKRLNAK
jgi:hypothetical protein